MLCSSGHCVLGVFINRIVKWTTTLAQRPEAVARLPVPARVWAPTAVGLSAIPLIVHPIDR
jgi:fission process protein 1